MICGNVVYHVSGNEFLSAYCGLEAGHKGECRYIPPESLVRICKQLLIERGEVIIPLRVRSYK